MPNVHLTGREIIARYDMVEIFVKKTNNNLEKIKTIKGDLVDHLAEFYRKPKKAKRQSRWIRQNFNNQYGNIIILWLCESNNNELLRIRIIDTCKWDWEVHRDNIRFVGDILDICGIEYAISKAEIAFDTLNKDAADNFNTRVSIKWGRPNNLFNYSKGEYCNGGSPNGRDEYMFKRECPRQTHSYKKEYKLNGLCVGKVEETICRWELRLRRKYLLNKAINTIDELFSNAEELIENSLVFKKLNRKKLNREIRRAKDWRLAGKSIAAQCSMLRRNGLSPDQIRKYFEVVKRPRNIIFALGHEDDIGTQKSPCEYRYALYGEMSAKLRSITKG
jgi:hypothetical protein